MGIGAVAAGLVTTVALLASLASAQQPTSATVYVRAGADDPSVFVSHVVVGLDGATSLRAATLNLEFDPAIVTPDRVELESGWTEAGGPVPTNPGSLRIDAVRPGDMCAAGTQCALATVTWKPVTAGVSRLEFSGVHLLAESESIEDVALVPSQISIPGAAAGDGVTLSEPPASVGSGPRYDLAAVALAMVVLACSTVGGATLIVAVGRRLLGSGGERETPTSVEGADFRRGIATYFEEVESAGSVDVVEQ
jgi:hypothetical protein